MIEDPTIDLTTLVERFVEHGDYTKEVILEELQYRQSQPDFLCLTDGEGFFIAYRHRDSLWIAQTRSDEGLLKSRKAMAYATKWALDRNMTSITFETARKEVKAMSRYGAIEDSVIMRIKL